MEPGKDQPRQAEPIVETDDGRKPITSPTDETASVQGHEKPLLSVSEQIAHLKSKGITFNTCTEAAAAEYLAGKCQFFKVTAYRKLFEKHVGGEKDGQYIGLDFGQLKYLADLDRRLRDVLLPMTLDVEHFAAVSLLKSAEVNGEDGYAVMRDYLESVPERRRAYIENELEIRSADAYCGAVIRKYRSGMPVWAFVEVVSFGTFIGLCKFCAERWEDEDLLASHYLLKKAKSVRNASAHSQCILNDMSSVGPQERVSPAVMQAVAVCGIGRRLRAKKMRNPRMAQVATLFYQYSLIVPEGCTANARKASLSEFFRYCDETADILPDSNPAASSIAFLHRLTTGFGLLD